jgi:hypothetical protein
MVEVRGVEPLSANHSAYTSTCIARSVIPQVRLRANSTCYILRYLTGLTQRTQSLRLRSLLFIYGDGSKSHRYISSKRELRPRR